MSQRLDNILVQAIVSAENIPAVQAEERINRLNVPEKSRLFNEYLNSGVLTSNNWYPACGGTEEPFTSRSGKRLLYCWCPATGAHAYLDLGSDIFLSNDEAVAAMGTF